MADQDGQLYVGTPAGLQVYFTLPLALDQMSALVGRRDPAGIGLVPVERVRIPVDSSKLLMARFSQECLERSGGAGFSGCASVAMLDRRLRVDTDYWQWVDSPTGLKGAYRADSGRLFGGGITARQDDGRLYGGIDESHA